MADSRRVGVAVDFSPCSKKALKWAVDNIVRSGDHLILLTVRPEGNYEEGEMQLWEATGSLSIFMYPETLDILTTAARQKEIVVVLKIYWGDAREKLIESVDNIPLDTIVIGNRGLGKLKRVIMGSVSNFVVNNATCPVTVVKSHD